VGVLFSQQLRQRVAKAGSTPLITYYDDGTGERTELSALSFGNWVDKTANLLVDELLIEPGSPVSLRLAQEAPAHWTTLVWVAAIWRVGCPVVIGAEAEPAVEVAGPADAFDAENGGTTEQVACSLHPLGLGFGTALPEDVLDYGVEVRGQSDAFNGPLPGESSPAWIDNERRLDQADVASGFEGMPGLRRMIAPQWASDPSEQIWPTLRRALVEPVLTHGSVVVFIGDDPTRRQQVADSERVDADPTRSGSMLNGSPPGNDSL
jgi:uncharacterized protein (TIGR03089 family)